MAWARDLTGVEAKKKGSYRSLNGAADENIFTGRASKAGFYCFFKVWRDMPYDAVLDYSGILYRVEVKGSSNTSFDFSRGERSGAQIKRGAGISRSRLLSHDDCDFAVAVNSINGDCYIVPEDVIEAIGNPKLSKNALADYKEKWELLMPDKTNLSKEQTRDGISSMSLTDLNVLAARLRIVIPAGPVKIKGTRSALTDPKAIAIYTIWTETAKKF